MTLRKADTNVIRLETTSEAATPDVDQRLAHVATKLQLLDVSEELAREIVARWWTRVML